MTIDVNKINYLWAQDEQKSEVLSVYSLEAEFTRPFWVFGISSYDFFLSDEQTNVLACTYRSLSIILSTFSSFLLLQLLLE